MNQGPLKQPLRCWLRTTPYDLQKGLHITAEWDDALKWWEVTFLDKNQQIKATTTDWPKFDKQLEAQKSWKKGKK